MSGDSFLLNYLYGPSAAINGWRSADTAELPAIPGRRAPAHLAKRFSQIMVSVMTDALEPHGLTPAQWGVMVAIIREPGTDQRRVAERQSIDANSASRLIDELEQWGWCAAWPPRSTGAATSWNSPLPAGVCAPRRWFRRSPRRTAPWPASTRPRRRRCWTCSPGWWKPTKHMPVRASGDASQSEDRHRHNPPTAPDPQPLSALRSPKPGTRT